MADQRLVGVAIPLTSEQIEQIRSATGAACSEVLFFMQTSKSGAVENELTSQADTELAQATWEANQKLASGVTGGGYDHAPALTFVR